MQYMVVSCVTRLAYHVLAYRGHLQSQQTGHFHSTAHTHVCIMHDTNHHGLAWHPVGGAAHNCEVVCHRRKKGRLNLTCCTTLPIVSTNVAT